MSRANDHGALRAVLRESLAAFTAKALMTLEPARQFQPSDHIEVMADRLERVSRGEVQRLIINVPPRHLKSMLASVAFVAWHLGHAPATRLVLHRC